MKLNDLQDVLVDGLRDLYNAERQLTKALPRMAKAAHSTELRQALQEHLAVTEGHVKRLESAFEQLEKPARGKTCRGMEGLIEEGRELLEARKASQPEAFDAALIAAAQKVEHYEISAYGSCRAHAETLGLGSVAELLQETLDEESQANEKLNELALASVNAEAVTSEQER